MTDTEFDIASWRAVEVGKPMVHAEGRVKTKELAPTDVVVEVAGCGVCHTDLGFLYDGVRTGKPMPLTLGHEIAGRVVWAGDAHQGMRDKAVVIPAVIPCGECSLCRAGRGSICRKQVFLGSDLDGGFATHVVAPGRGLCVVDEARLASSGLVLSELSVLADAISTPFQAIQRAGLGKGDLAIFVGAGGVGGFGVQIAKALGADVIAIDVSADKLARAEQYGASLTILSKDVDAGDVRKRVQAAVKERGWSPYSWKIFETSGHPAGQLLAFTLLTFGATLSVVGYTLDKVTVRLSNLMAFDATAQGNWGCLPEHYPAALDLILDGRISVRPLVERRPLDSINETFEALHHGGLAKRPILEPVSR
ncbi:MAG: 6-hydroxycyclohex-1-ene-1-carbonyl-CoA dehydrogenase [Sandaracinus sp.]